MIDVHNVPPSRAVTDTLAAKRMIRNRPILYPSTSDGSSYNHHLPGFFNGEKIDKSNDIADYLNAVGRLNIWDWFSWTVVPQKARANAVAAFIENMDESNILPQNDADLCEAVATLQVEAKRRYFRVLEDKYRSDPTLRNNMKSAKEAVKTTHVPVSECYSIDPSNFVSTAINLAHVFNHNDDHPTLYAKLMIEVENYQRQVFSSVSNGRLILDEDTFKMLTTSSYAEFNNKEHVVGFINLSPVIDYVTYGDGSSDTPYICAPCKTFTGKANSLELAHTMNSKLTLTDIRKGDIVNTSGIDILDISEDCILQLHGKRLHPPNLMQYVDSWLDTVGLTVAQKFKLMEMAFDRYGRFPTTWYAVEVRKVHLDIPDCETRDVPVVPKFCTIQLGDTLVHLTHTLIREHTKEVTADSHIVICPEGESVPNKVYVASDPPTVHTFTNATNRLGYLLPAGFYEKTTTDEYIQVHKWFTTKELMDKNHVFFDAGEALTYVATTANEQIQSTKEMLEELSRTMEEAKLSFETRMKEVQLQLKEAELAKTHSEVGLNHVKAENYLTNNEVSIRKVIVEEQTLETDVELRKRKLEIDEQEGIFAGYVTLSKLNQANQDQLMRIITSLTNKGVDGVKLKSFLASVAGGTEGVNFTGITSILSNMDDAAYLELAATLFSINSERLQQLAKYLSKRSSRTPPATDDKVDPIPDFTVQPESPKPPPTKETSPNEKEREAVNKYQTGYTSGAVLSTVVLVAASAAMSIGAYFGAPLVVAGGIVMGAIGAFMAIRRFL